MRALLWGVALCALAGGAAAAEQAPPPAQRRPARNLQVLPKTLTPAQVTATMRTMAVSLGVGCDFCHIQEAFNRDDKDTKQIARRMMRMVEAINHQNFDDRPEVTCYTCHRGAVRPIRQPPAAPRP